jgi:hypothetical protein
MTMLLDTQSPSFKPFPQLPAELYQAIIQQVADKGTLLSVSLVSKFFYESAAPVLYRHLDLRILQDDDWQDNYGHLDSSPYDGMFCLRGWSLESHAKSRYEMVEGLNRRNARYVKELSQSQGIPFDACTWDPKDGDLVLKIFWATGGVEFNDYQCLELSKMPHLRSLK